MLMIFTIARNNINPIIITNPSFVNFLAFSISCFNVSIAEKANTATIGTVIGTNRDLFGNSTGENEEIVRRIKMPEIIVASTCIYLCH
jgi:hypothetical protein